jgi:hypothetical protein
MSEVFASFLQPVQCKAIEIVRGRMEVLQERHLNIHIPAWLQDTIDLRDHPPGVANVL